MRFFPERFVAALAAASTLAACSMTPVYTRPDVPVPAQFQAAAQRPGGEAVSLEWWKRFGDAELDVLIASALAANRDLRAAVTRIEQARASARIARASLFPSIGATASGDRTGRGGDGRSGTSSSDQVGLSVGYELDLWGGNAAGARAADARVLASAYGRDAVELVLQADVASSYFQLLALRDRLAIARKNLDASRELMSLVQLRFDNGAASALEVSQQRANVLAVEAEIPAIEQGVQQTLHALAVLLGRAPEGLQVAGDSLSALTLPSVDPGVPAELLERRPDVRVAEANLRAANADIGAARAALYPNITLSATATAAGLLTAGSSSVASIALSLAQTLFDGGRRRGQVALSEASQRELVERYAQAVLASLKDVEDSLVAIRSSGERSAILEERVLQARESQRLARIRFDAGIENMLTLLDSQRTQLAAEDTLVQARLGRYTATVGLFKALGGGWGKPGDAPAETVREARWGIGGAR